VTIAPEQTGAIEFIRRAVASGVVVSIGHTGAEPEQVAAAVDAGARMSTHLGNGAHGMLRRHPNYIWEQLGERRLWAGVITDGHHLPASVVRSIIDAKGLGRTIITCDASGLAGCPPGRYSEGAIDVEILDDGRLVVAGQRQYLAGSGHETDYCVARAIEQAGLSLREALDCAGRNPAVLLGCEEIRLRRNARADLILFHWNKPGDPLRIETTVIAGEVQHGELPAASVCMKKEPRTK
jgi:N-acetylglucosamine-6-phosphate deacetylase